MIFTNMIWKKRNAFNCKLQKNVEVEAKLLEKTSTFMFKNAQITASRRSVKNKMTHSYYAKYAHPVYSDVSISPNSITEFEPNSFSVILLFVKKYHQTYQYPLV